jgi:hypothetical protein
MNELIQKISSYNIFNYLFPGTLFVILLSVLTRYDLSQKDLLTAAFIYYFIGLCISRVGSLVIEPALKKISFLKFADYHAFMKASAKDPKLEVLSEANNTYRTLCATLVLLIVFKIYEIIEIQTPWLQGDAPYILLGALVLLFFFSYRKQTTYITKRINHHT